MKIAVIGPGNVGSALAEGWANKGRKIFLGTRNPEDEKYNELISNENISIHSIEDAAEIADVILIALPPEALKEACDQFGDLSDKVIIDAMNSFSSKAGDFESTSYAIKDWTNCWDVVKCFNTIGYEGMKNPDYNGISADMFTAGDSAKGKEIAMKLSNDLGFEKCYDFGGDDKFTLLEELAFAWINLAIFRKAGRDIAFKVLKR